MISPMCAQLVIILANRLLPVVAAAANHAAIHVSLAYSNAHHHRQHGHHHHGTSLLSSTVYLPDKSPRSLLSFEALSSVLGPKAHSPSLIEKIINDEDVRGHKSIALITQSGVCMACLISK